MPESCTDRPTKAHEYLFLLSKSRKYYYDAESISEPSITNDNRHPYTSEGAWQLDGRPKECRRSGKPRTASDCSRRNKRSVWKITTQSILDAHFATFPEKLVEPCILAGTSERECCSKCGAPWERIIEKWVPELRDAKSEYPGVHTIATRKYKHGESGVKSKTIGSQPTCKCKADIKSCIVLDPFIGSGTTAIVAYKHNRKFIGIDLSESYLKDIAIPRIEKATKQLKLF